jgi:integrase
VALPQDVTSDEFQIAYAAFLAGDLAQARPKRPEPQPGSIGALVVSYLSSREFRALRASTKRRYAVILEILRVDHGHRTVSGMTRKGVAFILAPYADRPGALTNLIKVLRILIRHALALDWLRHDPSLAIKRPRLREVRSWTDAEIAQFEAYWPVGTKERLAFSMHLHTGQRRSDVSRMTWADLEGATIRVVQLKTGAALSIPLHAGLRAILDVTPRRHVAIITSGRGKPFSTDGYSTWLRAAIRAAGLPDDCRVHGLRKAAGRRLADAGCTPHEIMAVLGHKSLSEAERYTRGADQKRLASAAVIKLEARNGNRWAQTAPDGVGENDKN